MRDPSACRHCGIPKMQHCGQYWKPPVGWHVWTEPTMEQRYAAIRANVAERKTGGDAHE
jgi:hypothetical protein